MGVIQMGGTVPHKPLPIGPSYGKTYVRYILCSYFSPSLYLVMVDPLNFERMYGGGIRIWHLCIPVYSLFLPKKRWWWLTSSLTPLMESLGTFYFQEVYITGRPNRSPLSLSPFMMFFCQGGLQIKGFGSLSLMESSLLNHQCSL